MRIVFMGTPEFAVKSLERLYLDGHDIAGVFTREDKPKNRGMKLSFSPVKMLALSHGTPVFQPASFKDGKAAETIKELCCDLIVVVAYGKILPKDIIDIPPSGCINIHGSILPKYRGAAPVQHAVINGETETGVTSQYISEKMDAGDIIFVKKINIDCDETSAELYDQLSILGAELLGETVDAIKHGEVIRIPQDDSEATYAPLLTKEMSNINWNKTAAEIKCLVRGLQPWPVASMMIDGKILKVYKVDLSENISGKKPGDIISYGKPGIEIACADGTVMICDVQAPGGKRMSAADYTRGNPLQKDCL